MRVAMVMVPLYTAVETLTKTVANHVDLSQKPSRAKEYIESLSK